MVPPRPWKGPTNALGPQGLGLGHLGLLLLPLHLSLACCFVDLKETEILEQCVGVAWENNSVSELDVVMKPRN